MTISFVAAALGNDELGTNTATCSFVVPAGSATGDVLLVFLHNNVTFQTITTPTTGTGWVSLGTMPDCPSGSSVQSWGYKHVVAAGEPGTTLTFTCSTSGHFIGIMLAYRACNVDAVTAATAGSNGSPASSYPAPAVTAANNNSYIVNVWSARAYTGSGYDVSPPASHTTDGQSNTTLASTVNLTMRAAHLTASPVTAGSYGSYSATGPGATALMWSVALLPTSGNSPPTANAGPDQNVQATWTPAGVGGPAVTLTGAASTDPDGTVASYAWTQISGTTVTLAGTGATRTFTVPRFGGVLVFGLTVTDNGGATSAQDTIQVTVTGVAYGYARVAGAWVKRPLFVRRGGAWS